MRFLALAQKRSDHDENATYPATLTDSACTHSQEWVLADAKSKLSQEKESAKFQKDSSFCERKPASPSKLSMTTICKLMPTALTNTACLALGGKHPASLTKSLSCVTQVVYSTQLPCLG